ncbi:hypothetical protein [Azospirillum sp. sgz302134]
MAAKRKPIYPTLDLNENQATEPPEVEVPSPPAALADLPTPARPPSIPTKQPTGRSRGRPKTDRDQVRAAAKPFPLYLNPEGHKALKRYAQDTERRMHDVLMEWVEEGARKAGFRAPFRVQSDS